MLEYGVVVARWPLTPTVLVQFRLLLPKIDKFQLKLVDFFFYLKFSFFKCIQRFSFPYLDFITRIKIDTA